MARKEITTPLDLKNLDNHNDNYDELYGLIDETDRRISEDMWEEIKDANTMKMLEPVQTAADLPSEAADKSLITVIDEQRVYGFVNGEWQPFNQIDLDPFEPFKDELAAIVAAYEKQIQNITQEVQSTKDSAIDSINQTQAEAESQISTIRDEMTTQASDLTALFNDSMDKLTSKQNTALAEVENAKQAAITALEDFNNTDTSNWQKHKLTEDDGYIPRMDNVDMSDLDSFMEINSKHMYLFDPINTPTLDDDNGYLTISARSSSYAQAIFSPINDNTVYMNNKIGSSYGWDGWKPISGTKVVLFSGGASGVDTVIDLVDDYDKYTSLTIYGDVLGTDFVLLADPSSTKSIFLRPTNVTDSDGNGAQMYEARLEKTTTKKLTIKNDVYYDIKNDIGSGANANKITVNKIVGWN